MYHKVLKGHIVSIPQLLVNGAEIHRLLDDSQVVSDNIDVHRLGKEPKRILPRKQIMADRGAFISLGFREHEESGGVGDILPQSRQNLLEGLLQRGQLYTSQRKKKKKRKKKRN